jgi:hypothetical protein
MAAPFNVMAVFVVGRDRLYRVYCDAESLHFLRVGGQTAKGTGRPAVAGGGLGVALGAAITAGERLLSPERIAEIDRDPRAAIGQHEHDMSVPVANVVASSLEPPSFLGGQGKHVGRWIMTLRDGKKWKFQFDEPEQMKIAAEELPKTLGDRLQMKATWDEARQKFVKAI